MIYPNRFSDFLEQDCLAHSRRRDNEAALPPSKRRQQVNCPGADGIRLWIFQHDPALGKLRRQFVEVRRLAPLVRWLAFDHCDLFNRKELLALARWPYYSGEFRTGTQAILLDHLTWNANILGDGQKVQLRPAKHSERVVHLIEEAFRRNRCPGVQCRASYVKNVMMTRARRMQMQIQIARQRFQLFTRKFLQFVQINWGRRSRSRERRPRPSDSDLGCSRLIF